MFINWVIETLYVSGEIKIKETLTVISFLILSSHALACTEISGTYHSVSETHWNFELTIEAESAILIYTNYTNGQKDTRTDEKTISHGYCEKSGESFKLNFADKELPFTYIEQLSRASFGGQGHSAGISGEFIENREIELWLNP